MRASLLKSTLQALIPAGRSVAIEGPPGGGKTTIVHEVAESLGLPIVERHMPTMLVEDFGIPYPTDNGFEYKLPDWFPYKGKAGTENGGPFSPGSSLTFATGRPCWSSRPISTTAPAG